MVIVSIVALAIWIYLVFAHGNFWRGRDGIALSPEPETWPSVLVVIPARDEADLIGTTMASHMACDYPGEKRIILVDDQSSDGTADIARSADTGDWPLSVIEAPALRTGWTGKLWALHYGLQSLEHVPSKYILFADADIEYAPDTLRKMVAKAEADQLSMVSITARFDSRGFWGGFLMPAFVYFFSQFYPFGRANNPRSDVAAAFGGCLMVHREIFESAGGIASIRNALIDDCTLAKVMKDADPNSRIHVSLGKTEVLSLRDNSTFDSIWSMVVRLAFTQLGRSYLSLAGSMLGVVLTYFVPPIAVLSTPWHGSLIACLAGLGAWALMAFSYLPTIRMYEKPAYHAVFLPFAAFYYFLMTVTSGIEHFRGNTGLWKGRTYADL